MKKLLFFLVISLFLNNNAYAKLVKLNCSFRDAYVVMDNNRTKKLTPDMDSYQYYSADDIISFNEDFKSFVGMKADRFDDEIISVTMLDEIKGPKGKIDLKKVWTVNRVTGVLTKEIYTKVIGRDTSWGTADTIRYDCRKAKKKS